MITDRQKVNFWKKVNKQEGGCWIWTASRTVDGYGEFKVGCAKWKSHRLSWALANNAHPGAKYVLHSCDNPPCVNPAHLSLGTQTDNMQDMYKKGRQPLRCGEMNGNSKLTTDVVIQIREMYSSGKYTKKELARRFDIASSAMCSIINGHHWKNAQLVPSVSIRSYLNKKQ